MTDETETIQSALPNNLGLSDEVLDDTPAPPAPPVPSENRIMAIAHGALGALAQHAAMIQDGNAQAMLRRMASYLDTLKGDYLAVTAGPHNLDALSNASAHVDHQTAVHAQYIDELERRLPALAIPALPQNRHPTEGMAVGRYRRPDGTYPDEDKPAEDVPDEDDAA